AFTASTACWRGPYRRGSRSATSWAGEGVGRDPPPVQGAGRMVRIRPMTDADLALGMRLKDQAGWNQTEADWRRFLALEPDGCFVAELDATPVATTVTCTFGPVAWLAMVLVEAAVRGRGIGTALAAHALAFLDG